MLLGNNQLIHERNGADQQMFKKDLGDQFHFLLSVTVLDVILRAIWKPVIGVYELVSLPDGRGAHALGDDLRKDFLAGPLIALLMFSPCKALAFVRFSNITKGSME